MFKTVVFGMKESFKGAWYKALFIISAIVLFGILVLIPAKSVPGNDIGFQLTHFSVQDYSVLIFLALLYALFITMQVYAMRSARKIKEVGTAVGGSLGAVFAGITGTAFCTSCLIPIFAFFGIGFGGILFILEYRLYFIIAIVLSMFIAIYFTAKRILKTCNNC